MTPLRILLVEDNRDDCFLVTYALNGCSIPLQLETVYNGAAAMERLVPGAPPLDLVLLDIQMPKLTGIEVLEQLQQTPEFLPPPIVMLSASDSPHDICRCLELGARDFLHKPLSITMFVDLLTRLGLKTEVAAP
jgi:CheY-like chemotaxis protein